VQQVKKVIVLAVRACRRFALEPGTSFLMVRMAGWVWVLSIVVKVWPLPKALALITTSSRTRAEASLQHQQYLAATLDKILKTRWYCLTPVCWKRAAVLHRYLALNGTTTKIVFGMRKSDNGTMQGHAWLELDGRPILETDTPEYTVTYKFPSDGQFEMELASLD